MCYAMSREGTLDVADSWKIIVDSLRESLDP